MRRLGNDGNLSVVLTLGGTMASLQDGRCAVQGAGDLLVLAHRPGVLASAQPGEALSLEPPRERPERVLGPARLYSALTVGADLAPAALTMTFFRDLARQIGRLSPASAERMATIGVDLIAASLAERMAQEVPRAVHGNVTVQRAEVQRAEVQRAKAHFPRRFEERIGLSPGAYRRTHMSATGAR